MLRWSDGSKANPRVDLNVARNVNVTAIFAAYASLVWVQFNFTGVEDGTQSYPFNTLDEGVNAVTTGGTIRILSGSTATGGRIDKSLRLEAWNGTVTVGR
ncbi:hypothetical protein EG834_17395 [bacterium]|nr:hypothetical protein [bacterium]